MPNTMTALTFLRKGRLEWRDVPAPRLHGPHEALVRFDPTRVTTRVSRWDESPDALLDRGPAKGVVARRTAFCAADCSAGKVAAL